MDYNIVETISFLISNAAINYFYIYFYHNLLDIRLENNKKNLVLLIIMTLLITVINILCPKSIKMILSIIIMLIIGYQITNRKIAETLIISILFIIELLITEIIAVGIIELFFTKRTNIFLVFISNILVTTIGILFLKTKIPQKIYNYIINPSKSLQTKEIIMYSLIVIIVIVFSLLESYIKLPIIITVIVNTTIGVITIIIIARFVTTKGKYKNISKKYQISISSLQEYERMIEKYRIYSHENKNELLTIRNMSNNNKRITEYIDKLIDNKIKDNEKIMKQTSKIPEGGLRATIYSKMCVMDEYKIKYKLDISKEIKTIDIINMNEENITNICKILGVFLDNAIESVKDLEEKNIFIELYIIDDKLYIDITNNFLNNINLEKLSKTKYTTKGENHGYGLLLVSKIIKENKNIFKNERKINGSLFTQSLEIKIKSGN